MDSSRTEVDRRAFLRASGVTAAAATGLFATAGQAAAGYECPCHQCWLDIKPGSCPNSINPRNQGVVSVAAGWPDFDPGTVKLVTREEAWGDCSERRSDYDQPDVGANCERVEEWLDEDHATPVRAERVDEDGDGDMDWVFKFETQALDLYEGVQSAILVGRDAQSGCPVWGVDSINIVGGSGGSNGGGRSNGGGGSNGGGKSNGGGRSNGSQQARGGRSRGRGN